MGKDGEGRRRALGYLGAAAVGTVVGGVAAKYFFPVEVIKEVTETEERTATLERPTTITETVTKTTITTKTVAEPYTPPPDRTPPLIENLSWEPTRVINSKVYDGNVSFIGIDEDSLVSEAYLEFSGIYPTNIPREAIPEEPDRRLVLKPMDGRFDSKVERFSQEITALKGGKEYKARAVVKDLADNQNERSLKIPYVREFDKIAKEGGTLFGAITYHAWWSYPNPNTWWNHRTGKPAVIHTPLLNYYDARYVNVFDRVIDWATGYGINFFLFEWPYPQSWMEPNLRHNLLKNSELIKSGEIRFGISYDSLMQFELGKLKKNSEGQYDLSSSENRNTILNDFEYLSRTYFEHPLYMKIKGKPLVFVYESWLYRGEVEDILNEIRYRFNPYLLGDFRLTEISPDTQSEYVRLQKRLMELFDGVTTYGPYSLDPNITNNIVKVTDKSYAAWSKEIKKLGIDFVPDVQAGANDSASRPELNHPIVEKNEEVWDKLCEIGIKYRDDSINMVLVTSLDEWYEDTQVLPATSYGFRYLEILKQNKLKV